MKKIINGVKYDTDTAICQYKRNNMIDNDIYVSLYQKRQGAFDMFLLTVNNSVRIGNKESFPVGEDIIPLTDKEAKEWAERRMPVDTYEAIFGIVEE